MPQLDKHQEIARDETGKSIIVSASAGAGKTSVLVERLLKRCIKDNIPLTSILALTFTKAAAEEMKKRLAKSLLQAYENETNPTKKDYIQTQLSVVHTAKITTIDAYCLSIIQKYYTLIGLDPKVITNTIDETTRSLYMHQAFEEVFDKYCKTHKEKLYRLILSTTDRVSDFHILENDLVTFNNIASSQSDPHAYFASVKDNLKEIHKIKDLPKETVDRFFAYLKSLVKKMYLHVENCCEVAEGKDIKVEEFDSFIESLKALEESIDKKDYQDFLAALSPVAVYATPAPNKDKPFSNAVTKLKSVRTEMLDAAFAEDIYVKVHNETLDVLKLFVDMACDMYDAFVTMKRDNGAMDFSDMGRYAMSILQANGGYAAKKLRDSYEEIMIDEFQDTSMLQNEILECIAKDDNIFRVGDVKQSIYRFRLAKPSLMRHLQNDPLQRHINLTKNYRSKQSIVEFNNDIFSKLMNIDSFHDVYDDKDIAKVGREEQKEEKIQPVRCYLFEDSADEEETGNVNNEDSIGIAKAKWTAQKIIQLQKENYNFKDICVLVRSHASKLPLRHAFDEYNIPYDMDIRSGFFNSDLAQTIKAIFKLTVRQNDAIALVTMLTSSLFNISNDTLIQNKDHLYLSSFEEADMFIQEVKNIVFSYGIAAALKFIQKYENFYDSLSAKEKANFDYLFEKCQSLEPIDIYRFLTVMEEGEDEKSSEASTNTKEADTVTVTTIHQSKGLQYKVVILFSQTKNPYKNEHRILSHETMGVAMQYCNTTYNVTVPTVSYLASKYADDVADQEEYIRLLYVATTRPVERLYVVDKMPGIVAKKVDEAMSALRNGFTGLLLTSGLNSKYLQKNKATIDPDILPLLPKQTPSTHFTYKPLPAKTLPPISTPSSLEVKTLPPLSFKDTTSATNYGTLVHETIEHLPNTVWTKEMFESSLLSSSYIDKIIRFSTHPIYQSALTMQITKEYPFFVIDKEANQTLTGSIDFFAYNDTDAIIIDFKTDHLAKEEILSRYRDQLFAYRKAISLLYPNVDIQLYIYSFYLEELLKIF